MIKLTNIISEAKTFGDSMEYTQKGIPFKDGLTPELKKEAEEYIKKSLKSTYDNDWKWKSWLSKNDPRIIHPGKRDAYLFGFCIATCKSPIMGKTYELEFDIKWKPNKNLPVVDWTIDRLYNQLNEGDIAPKVKKWFMKIKPEDMPKAYNASKLYINPRDIPQSFFEPFENDTVLFYYTGWHNQNERNYRVLDVFTECWKLYYDEWKKQHPNFFQKIANNVKKAFRNEDVNQPLTLKSLLKENSNDDLKQLEKMLKSHDWFYDFSDDHRSYTAGYKSMSKIRSLIKKLNDAGFKSETAKLWKKYNKSPK